VHRFGSPVLIAALAAAISLPVPASASAQVTLGQLAPPGAAFECEFGATAFDEAQLSISGGNTYTVPGAGAITSWSTAAGPAAGQIFGLKVFRPLGGGAYSVVGQDSRPLTPGVINTFPVAIPVAAGDVIGDSLPADDAPTDCWILTHNLADTIAFAAGNAATGVTVALGEVEAEVRSNITATFLPPPTIAAVAPLSAPIGGAPVVIAGANFADVTGVGFGGVPASFTVSSEGAITATAPPTKTLGSVPITVTTVAGGATAPPPFTYQGCRVPKLRGKKLTASKRASRKAECRVGKVIKKSGATWRTGKVVRQRPPAGKILAPRTKISVTLK
jgi:hypothetical protein